jgi:hypothetical protein
MFELAEASTLNIEDRLTAANIMVEALKGSRSGYVKMPLTGRTAAQDAPSQRHDTDSRSADCT